MTKLKSHSWLVKESEGTHGLKNLVLHRLQHTVSWIYNIISQIIKTGLIPEEQIWTGKRRRVTLGKKKTILRKSGFSHSTDHHGDQEDQTRNLNCILDNLTPACSLGSHLRKIWDSTGSLLSPHSPPTGLSQKLTVQCSEGALLSVCRRHSTSRLSNTLPASLVLSISLVL